MRAIFKLPYFPEETLMIVFSHPGDSLKRCECGRLATLTGNVTHIKLLHFEIHRDNEAYRKY